MMAALACCLGTVNAAVVPAENINMVNVQDEDNKFLGKWNMKVVDTPMGDYEMVIEIVKNEEGKILLNTGEFGEVECKQDEKKLTFDIDAGGVSVDGVIELVDDDNIKGSMYMGEFTVTMTRVKE